MSYSNSCLTIIFIQKKFFLHKLLISLTVTIQSPVKGSLFQVLEGALKKHLVLVLKLFLLALWKHK